MRIRVTFETELPAPSAQPTNDDIADWLAWELGASGRILGTNPFYKKSLAVDWESTDFEVVSSETEALFEDSAPPSPPS